MLASQLLCVLSVSLSLSQDSVASWYHLMVWSPLDLYIYNWTTHGESLVWFDNVDVPSWLHEVFPCLHTSLPLYIFVQRQEGIDAIEQVKRMTPIQQNARNSRQVNQSHDKVVCISYWVGPGGERVGSELNHFLVACIYGMAYLEKDTTRSRIILCSSKLE